MLCPPQVLGDRPSDQRMAVQPLLFLSRRRRAKISTSRFHAAVFAPLWCNSHSHTVVSPVLQRMSDWRIAECVPRLEQPDYRLEGLLQRYLLAYVNNLPARLRH